MKRYLIAAAVAISALAYPIAAFALSPGDRVTYVTGGTPRSGTLLVQTSNLDLIARSSTISTQDQVDPSLVKPVVVSTPTPSPTATPSPTPTSTPTATPTPSPTPVALNSTYPIGVWMQDPTRNAVAFKNVGVNVFVGLWNFPTDSGQYPGWSVDAVTALKNNGLTAFAGDDTGWAAAHPAISSALTGYLLGDEPDMNRVNCSNCSDWPDPWKQHGDQVKAAAAAQGREVYANFGKGFCLYPWSGYSGSESVDFPKYVEPETVLSCDAYWETDPYEGHANSGELWRYGWSLDNMERWASGKPVWGFLEAAGPWSGSNKINPLRIMPIVWMEVVHGADGIEYFCHDFSGSGLDSGCLSLSGSYMQTADTSIQKYADVLNSPKLSGTTATGLVSTRTHSSAGQTYVFAMGDGDSSHGQGVTVDSTITVPGGASGTVTVLDENRTLTMTNGSFTDHFTPYQHHVYRIG